MKLRSRDWRGQSRPYPNPFSPEAKVWELARGAGKTEAEVLEAAGYVPHDGTLLRDELLAQYRRDCTYSERIKTMPIERSAAFTALLEIDPPSSLATPCVELYPRPSATLAARWLTG